MVKIENLDSFNFQSALRGMRNPLESWERSDSLFKRDNSLVFIGEKDLDLAKRLIQGGPEHCKFLRQIFVSMDITAPLFWWKEMDTYKIGTTANSTSTMHKLVSKDLVEWKDLISYDKVDLNLMIDDENCIHDAFSDIMSYCDKLNKKYQLTKDKNYWRAMIQLLPCGWLQTRTWTGSYANLRNIASQRKYHKLIEWEEFLGQIRDLPYSKELIFYKGEKE